MELDGADGPFLYPAGLPQSLPSLRGRMTSAQKHGDAGELERSHWGAWVAFLEAPTLSLKPQATVILCGSVGQNQKSPLKYHPEAEQQRQGLCLEAPGTEPVLITGPTTL